MLMLFAALTTKIGMDAEGKPLESIANLGKLVIAFISGRAATVCGSASPSSASAGGLFSVYLI